MKSYKQFLIEQSDLPTLLGEISASANELNGLLEHLETGSFPEEVQTLVKQVSAQGDAMVNNIARMLEMIDQEHRQDAAAV